MNITAKAAAAKSNEILKPIDTTPEFSEIMASIERDINKAIADGVREIEVVSYSLAYRNGCKFPSFINRAAINLDTFWWPYVWEELVKNGFKVSGTITCDHYIVSW